MATLVQALQVDPDEIIKFKGTFSEVVTSDLKLTNPTDDQIAFKVKTTAPRKYAVRPNSGVINPGDTVVVSVMRQPFEAESSERVRHKFMIQSVKMTPGQTLATIWTEADPSSFMDTRLRVQFDDLPPPSNRIQESSDICADMYESSITSELAFSTNVKSSISDEEFHRVLSENDHLSKEVLVLKDESNELRNLLAKTTDAIERRLPKGVALLCHEKINVLIVLLCLIVSFVCGIMLSDVVMPPGAVPKH